MSTPSTDENRTPQPAGLRRRIVTPSPPAPVPTTAPKPLIDPEPEDGARLDRSSLTTAPTAGAATATARARTKSVRSRRERRITCQIWGLR